MEPEKETKHFSQMNSENRRNFKGGNVSIQEKHSSANTGMFSIVQERMENSLKKKGFKKLKIIKKYQLHLPRFKE